MGRVTCRSHIAGSRDGVGTSVNRETLNIFTARLAAGPSVDMCPRLPRNDVGMPGAIFRHRPCCEYVSLSYETRQMLLRPGIHPLPGFFICFRSSLLVCTLIRSTAETLNISSARPPAGPSRRLICVRDSPLAPNDIGTCPERGLGAQPIVHPPPTPPHPTPPGNAAIPLSSGAEDPKIPKLSARVT